MNSLHYLGIDVLPAQLVVHMNSLDHENFAFELYLSGSCPDQLASRCIYLTRLQRASQGAGQSAAGCSHHVVESRRVRRIVFRGYPVMLCNFGMDAKGDGIVPAG